MSHREFLPGTAAGLVWPRFYDKVLAYCENHVILVPGTAFCAFCVFNAKTGARHHCAVTSVRAVTSGCFAPRCDCHE